MVTENELTKLLQHNPDLSIAGGDTHHEITVTVPLLRPSEHDLQVALIAECDRRAATNPLWGLLFAIPNGGQRSKAVAGKLKAEGVRAGIPDLFLPVERHGYCGMFLELKVGKNPLSPMQELWLDLLSKQGYYCYVVRDSVQAAIQLIEWYLGGKA